MINIGGAFQTAVIEAAVELDKQELQHSRVLQTLVGACRCVPLCDGAEGSLRQECCRRISAIVRYTRLLHSAVRAHDPAPSHLQGGRLAWRRLLDSFHVFCFVRFIM